MSKLGWIIALLVVLLVGGFLALTRFGGPAPATTTPAAPTARNSAEPELGPTDTAAPEVNGVAK
jgi:hypothetical protein